MQSDQTKDCEVQPFASWAYAVLCMGFGCFFAICPFSALGTSAMLASSLGWQEVLLGRVVFLVAAAGWYLMRVDRLARGALRPGVSQERRTFDEALLGAAATVAGYVFLRLAAGFVSTGVLAVAYGVLLGIAMATLGNGWLRLFFAVRRTHGRIACIAAFSASFLLTVLLSWLFGLPWVGNMGSLVVVCGLAVASFGFLCLVLRAPRPTWWADAAPGVEFEPTPYARGMLLGFGVSWALAYNLTIELGYGTGPDGFARWAWSLVSCGALLVLVLLLARKLDIGAMRFGLLMRWVIAVVGSMWALMPACAVVAPIAVNIACIMVFWMQLTIFFIFVMEVCLERNLPFGTVLARYFATFVLAACLGSLAFWLIETFVADSWMAYSLVAAVAVVASLAVMPLMPSRGSNADVFTLERLPEDEDVVVRNERARRELAEECGFTPREAEVFDLLLMGCTREEIATRLQISPWTVKNHIRAVFAKTGTHSAKELMALVYGKRG